MSKDLFYWIKLGMDFFDQDTIDWLKDQDNGCDYIVLYLQLCLLSANNNGVLVRHVGDMVIPYNAKKIAEQTRFSLDTVMVAMRLFTRLGLIKMDDGGTITIPTVPSMVGTRSASKEATRKRAYRARKKNLALAPPKDNSLDSAPDNVPDNIQDNVQDNSSQIEGKVGLNADTMSHMVSGTKWDVKNKVDKLSRTRVGQSVQKRDKSTISGTKCPIEYRDKSIEYKRDDDERAREESQKLLARVVTYYQNNIHPVANEAEKDRLVELLNEFGAEWVLQAIKQAALNRAGTIRYVEVTLGSWRASGNPQPWKGGKSNGGHAGNRNRNADPADSEAAEIDWSQYDNTYEPGT